MGSQMPRRKYVVQISSRAYQMAKLAAGLLGEAVEPPVAKADEPGGPVLVTINKEAYRAARLVASITGQPWAAVVERMIVAHAEHVIGPCMGPVRIPSDAGDN
jgi:hypothetical protein